VMNGDAREIFDRIVALETQMIERWKAHELRSKDLIRFIEEKFKVLPCKEVNDKFKLVWTFITIIIVAVIGVSIKSLWAG